MTANNICEENIHTMSIAQLDDPSMREALGIVDDVLSSPVTMGSVTLRDGGGGVLEIVGATAGLEIVNPNPLATPITLAGQTLAGITTVNGIGGLALNAGQNGSVSVSMTRQGIPLTGGFQIQTTTGVSPTATGSLYFNPDGELSVDHIAPAASVSTQVLYKPCFVQALCDTASTPVGGGGSVIVPLTSLGLVSSTGNPSVADWAISGGNTLLSSAGVQTGTYEFNAAVQLQTTGVGSATVDVYFNQGGAFAFPNSASRFTLQPNEPQCVYIHDYFSLGAGQSIEVVVVSADPLVEIVTFPAVGNVPQILGCEMWVSRMA